MLGMAKAASPRKEMRVPRLLVTCDDRLEHALPIIGTVHVAGTERASFQITELVEHEERMVASTFICSRRDRQTEILKPHPAYRVQLIVRLRASS